MGSHSFGPVEHRAGLLNTVGTVEFRGLISIGIAVPTASTDNENDDR
jgi:hypothetical protein